MQASPLDRVPLTEQLAEHFSRLISDATWPPGTMLPPEPQLAQQFGVSRSVIRECVRVLVSRGMLDVRQGRGTTVTSPASWRVTEPLALLVRADRMELLHWLEVRTILEIESAGLAARRAGEEDRAILGAALERLGQSVADPDGYAKADVDFHLAIGAATQNPALVRLLRPVVQPLREHLQEAALLPEAQRAANSEHGLILACIVSGDAPGARAAMASHLTRVAEEIAAILNHRQALE
jgi:DNA-binding FadR family transcriptional regulator